MVRESLGGLGYGLETAHLLSMDRISIQHLPSTLERTCRIKNQVSRVVIVIEMLLCTIVRIESNVDHPTITARVYHKNKITDISTRSHHDPIPSYHPPNCNIPTTYSLPSFLFLSVNTFTFTSTTGEGVSESQRERDGEMMVYHVKRLLPLVLVLEPRLRARSKACSGRVASKPSCRRTGFSSASPPTYTS